MGRVCSSAIRLLIKILIYFKYNDNTLHTITCLAGDRPHPLATTDIIPTGHKQMYNEILQVFKDLIGTFPSLPDLIRYHMTLEHKEKTYIE